MRIIVDRLTYPDGLNAAVRQSRLIKRTIRDVCRLIMTDDVQDSIKLIRVRVLYRMKKNCYGICAVAGPDRYTITVGGRLDNDLFVATLAHEVAHVNQFAEGRLDSDSSHFWWYGDHLEPKRYSAQNYSHQEYLAWPWEREARSIESSYMKILSKK